MTLSKKYYHSSDGGGSDPIVLLYLCFFTKNKNENTEYYGTLISFKSHLYSKQASPIFLLFGLWSIVIHLSMFGLSQGFSNIFNMPILAELQRLHENGK